jgi:hypothetical protein
MRLNLGKFGALDFNNIYRYIFTRPYHTKLAI